MRNFASKERLSAPPPCSCRWSCDLYSIVQVQHEVPLLGHGLHLYRIHTVVRVRYNTARLGPAPRSLGLILNLLLFFTNHGLYS